MPITSEILKKYPNSTFVETGTNLGDGVKAALDAGFKQIYSFEVYHPNFLFSTNRFKDRYEVRIFEGDSSKLMPFMIECHKYPITFWLDAHCSGDGTGQGDVKCPLILELEVIKNHHVKITLF
jgi:hypothetical protein